MEPLYSRGCDLGIGRCDEECISSSILRFCGMYVYVSRMMHGLRGGDIIPFGLSLGHIIIVVMLDIVAQGA